MKTKPPGPVAMETKVKYFTSGAVIGIPSKTLVYTSCVYNYDKQCGTSLIHYLYTGYKHDILS